MKEEAYVIIDKNLGCRVLRFTPEGSFVTKVYVQETNEGLHHQYVGGVSEGDVLYSVEKRKNYKVVKMNATF